MTGNNEKVLLRVILCKPETDPRYDDVAIICNEEGKLMRLPPAVLQQLSRT